MEEVERVSEIILTHPPPVLNQLAVHHCNLPRWPAKRRVTDAVKTRVASAKAGLAEREIAASVTS